MQTVNVLLSVSALQACWLKERYYQCLTYKPVGLKSVTAQRVLPYNRVASESLALGKQVYPRGNTLAGNRLESEYTTAEQGRSYARTRLFTRCEAASLAQVCARLAWTTLSTVTRTLV